jgi:hypothetical protein
LNGRYLYFKPREDFPSDDYVEQALDLTHKHTHTHTHTHLPSDDEVEKALDQVVQEIVPLVLEK